MLTATDLCVARGGVPLLVGLNIEVTAGQLLILRGANGIGKTSLLRTLAGLQPPWQGDLHSTECAFSGHSDGLKSTLSVRENLQFWADIFGTSGVGNIIEQFDLAHLGDRPAGTLSAGQKRRLGLARLMLTGRRLWIMDEPTVSLDTENVERFLSVLRGRLTAGGAAILSTHLDFDLPAQVLDLSKFKAPKSVLDVNAEGFL